MHLVTGSTNRASSASTFAAPVTIAELHSSAAAAAPSISADGKTLYFSRRNNLNNNEIWYATRQYAASPPRHAVW